jgi:hypothetical protein
MMAAAAASFLKIAIPHLVFFDAGCSLPEREVTEA